MRGAEWKLTSAGFGVGKDCLSKEVSQTLKLDWKIGNSSGDSSHMGAMSSPPDKGTQRVHYSSSTTHAGQRKGLEDARDSPRSFFEEETSSIEWAKKV